MIGKIFGDLTVISKIDNNKKYKALWLCKCSCGVEKIVKHYNLTGGKIRSCGCVRTKNKTGDKYGKLTILRRIKSNKFEVKCECGNFKIINSENLLSGRTTSCGCSKQERLAGKTLVENWIIIDYLEQIPEEQIAKDYRRLNNTTLDEAIKFVEAEILKFWGNKPTGEGTHKKVCLDLFNGDGCIIRD